MRHWHLIWRNSFYCPNCHISLVLHLRDVRGLLACLNGTGVDLCHAPRRLAPEKGNIQQVRLSVRLHNILPKRLLRTTGIAKLVLLTFFLLRSCRKRFPPAALRKTVASLRYQSGAVNDYKSDTTAEALTRIFSLCCIDSPLSMYST